LSQTPLDFLNLFVESPGDLLYFLVVIAISQAALFMALGHRSRFPYERTTQRYVVATFALVGVWILLLAGALLSLLLSENSSAILPPLERLAYTITLLMLSWAYLSADRAKWGRWANRILIGSVGIAVVLYVITAIQWRGAIEFIPVFNLSLFAPLWSFIPILIAVLGLVFVVVNFPSIVDAPIKSVFFVVIILGNGLNLIQFAQGQVFGNYLGSARLAYVSALVILPLVIYRLVVSSLENSVAEVALTASQPSATIQTQQPKSEMHEKKADTTLSTPAKSSTPIETQSVQLLKAMGLMMEAEETSQIPERVVSAAIDNLRVDFGILLKIQDANYADVISGYDRVKDRAIAGISLSLEEQPTLVNAIERRTQRALFTERNTEELDDLYRRIDIDQQGTVYIQPLTKQQELVGVLVVGFPYQQRELKSPEVELLKGIGIIASNLLALSFEAEEATLMAEERAIQAMIEGVPIDSVDESDVVNARREMEASLQLARDQISQLSRQVSQLKLQLDDERKRVLEMLGDTEDDLSVSQRINVIFEEQEQLRDERDVLTRELLDAETALTTLTVQDDEALANDITESLQREYDSLINARDRLRSQIDDLRAQDKTVINEDVQTLIQSMSEETARLEFERNQLSDKLTDIQSQLNTMGIEGGIASITQVVTQLYSERKALNNRVEKLQRERDLLLSERSRNPESRGVKIEELQRHIKHLASDREASIKLRDRMRSDYRELLSKFEAVRDQKNKLQGKVKELIAEVSQNHSEQEKLQHQVQQLADEKSNLLKIRDQLKAQIDSMRAESSIETEPSEETQTVIRTQLTLLQAMIKDLTEQREKLELELNYTQTALAEARNQNDQLQLSAAKGEIVESTNYNLNNPELFVGLVQELRTPMTSIIGYIDLLLGESAGILGEMQRNFLQRVSINVQRLASMIDDLVKMTQLDTGSFDLHLAPVDLIALIEDAITNSSNQFREKDLIVNLSLDDSVPNIPVDSDGIRQIIGQLLTNAYLVSPAGSDISVHVESDTIVLPQSEQPEPVLLIVVEDQGGGILPEDIPRVFARKYKAENPLIDGLGDTGVGMSIAKAFTEAHGGYMWVESEPGIGSSFKVALPVNLTTSVEE